MAQELAFWGCSGPSRVRSVWSGRGIGHDETAGIFRSVCQPLKKTILQGLVNNDTPPKHYVFFASTDTFVK